MRGAVWYAGAGPAVSDAKAQQSLTSRAHDAVEATLEVTPHPQCSLKVVPTDGSDTIQALSTTWTSLVSFFHLPETHDVPLWCVVVQIGAQHLTFFVQAEAVWRGWVDFFILNAGVGSPPRRVLGTVDGNVERRGKVHITADLLLQESDARGQILAEWSKAVAECTALLRRTAVTVGELNLESTLLRPIHSSPSRTHTPHRRPTQYIVTSEGLPLHHSSGIVVKTLPQGASFTATKRNNMIFMVATVEGTVQRDHLSVRGDEVEVFCNTVATLQDGTKLPLSEGTPIRFDPSQRGDATQASIVVGVDVEADCNALIDIGPDSPCEEWVVTRHAGAPWYPTEDTTGTALGVLPVGEVLLVAPCTEHHIRILRPAVGYILRRDAERPSALRQGFLEVKVLQLGRKLSAIETTNRETASEEVAALQLTIQGLQKDCEDAKLRVEDMEAELKHSVAQHALDTSLLEDRLEQQEEQQAHLKDVVGSKNNTIENLKKQIADEAEMRAEEGAVLRAQVGFSRKQNDDTERALQRASATTVALHSTIEALEEQLSESTAELKLKDTQLAELSSATEDAVVLKEEVALLNRDVAAMQTSLDTAHTALGAAEVTSEVKAEEITNIKKELQRVQEELVVCDAEREVCKQEMAVVVAERGEIAKEMEDVHRTVAVSAGVEETLRAELLGVCRERDGLIEELSQCRTDLASSADEAELLRADVTQLRESLLQKGVDIGELEDNVMDITMRAQTMACTLLQTQEALQRTAHMLNAVSTWQDIMCDAGHLRSVVTLNTEEALRIQITEQADREQKNAAMIAAHYLATEELERIANERNTEIERLKGETASAEEKSRCTELEGRVLMLEAELQAKEETDVNEMALLNEVNAQTMAEMQEALQEVRRELDAKNQQMQQTRSRLEMAEASREASAERYSEELATARSQSQTDERTLESLRKKHKISESECIRLRSQLHTLREHKQSEHSQVDTHTQRISAFERELTIKTASLKEAECQASALRKELDSCRQEALAGGTTPTDRVQARLQERQTASLTQKLAEKTAEVVALQERLQVNTSPSRAAASEMKISTLQAELATRDAELATLRERQRRVSASDPAVEELKARLLRCEREKEGLAHLATAATEWERVAQDRSTEIKHLEDMLAASEACERAQGGQDSKLRTQLATVTDKYKYAKKKLRSLSVDPQPRPLPSRSSSTGRSYLRPTASSPSATVSAHSAASAAERLAATLKSAAIRERDSRAAGMTLRQAAASARHSHSPGGGGERSAVVVRARSNSGSGGSSRRSTGSKLHSAPVHKRGAIDGLREMQAMRKQG